MRQIFNICLVAQLVAAMSAQELRWNLPPHGAAIYQRTWQQETSAEPKSADHNVPGLDQNSAPVVLSDELDAKGMQTTEPVLHMRALFPFVALNLGFVKPCKVAVKLNQQLRNAAMNAEAEYGPLSNSGEQTIAVTLGPGPKETVRLPDNNGGPQISGKIIGKRTIDRTNGRVASFTAKFELNYEFQNPARKVHLDATESWTFDKVLAHGDAEFRSMVTAGIRKAVAALRTELKSQLGQPLEPGVDPHFNIQTGQLALLLLSLVKGGEDPSNELIAKGYLELRQRVIEGTYSLACAILAIEALYTPPSEAQEIREGRLKAPIPRVLSGGDRALVTEWTKAMLKNIDERVDEASLRRWFYGPGKDFDNSNTQYALLGLYAAQLCGIDTPAVLWTTAANHWLRVIVTSGESGSPLLVTHTDLEKQQKGGKTRATGTKIPCVGWCYKSDDSPTGSMTCAGISGLSLCSSALRTLKKSPLKLQREIDEALRGGLLWLQRNISVRYNPGPEGAWSNWHFYYLYGLERACELNQIALLGDTDWYFDGAMELLLRQTKEGTWDSPENTCFGLLFLKKTALPAITR